jgi:anaerobic magnesium-protoporphyrin IX monomethyl ester cyclase
LNALDLLPGGFRTVDRARSTTTTKAGFHDHREEGREMKPRLLLLGPVTWYHSVKLPGLGLFAVGAMVRDDCELQLVDANIEGWSLKDFMPKLQKVTPKPDLIAIQCQNTNRVFNVLTMCETIKKTWGDIPIITGGTHASLDADFLIKTRLIDYVVVGEGEVTFRELVHRLIGKTDKPFEEIQGLCLLKDGKPFRTTARPFIKNLDDLPIPAWELIDVKRLRDNSPFGTFTMIETSRGCAFGCTFCSPALLWKRTWRKKSPERVALEFRKQEERGFEFTWLAELDPCHDPDHIRDFCSALVKQGNTIRWFSQQRADQITAHPDLAEIMYAAGCRVANVGYESMSIRTLRSFNKGTTPEMNQKARDILKKNHIVTNGGLIIGVPGETKAEMMSTIKFGLSLDFPDFAILRPYPATRWGANNEEHREKYKKFNEGWCFLHENPRLVEFLHKYATAMSWLHPKRMLAYFSPDDFRRGFARWRYQVYAEVLAKRFYDTFKNKIGRLLAKLPGFKAPEQIQDGMEEYRFLPPGAEEAMDNPAAAATPEMMAQMVANADGGNGAGGNGSSAKPQAAQAEPATEAPKSSSPPPSQA